MLTYARWIIIQANRGEVCVFDVSSIGSHIGDHAQTYIGPRAIILYGDLHDVT